MGHLKSIVKEFRGLADAAGGRGDLRRAEKRLAGLERKSAKLCTTRAALPPGTSRARVTTANARWARVAEARDRAEREVAELRSAVAGGHLS